MTERELQQALLDAARLSGWTRRYHTHDSRRSEAGFPDLVLVHPRRLKLAFIEVKAAKGRVSDAQRGWLGDLELIADAAATRPIGEYPFRPIDVGIANPGTFDSWLDYLTLQTRAEP